MPISSFHPATNGALPHSSSAAAAAAAACMHPAFNYMFNRSETMSKPSSNNHRTNSSNSFQPASTRHREMSASSASSTSSQGLDGGASGSFLSFFLWLSRTSLFDWISEKILEICRSSSRVTVVRAETWKFVTGSSIALDASTHTKHFPRHQHDHQSVDKTRVSRRWRRGYRRAWQCSDATDHLQFSILFASIIVIDRVEIQSNEQRNITVQKSFSAHLQNEAAAQRCDEHSGQRPSWWCEQRSQWHEPTNTLLQRSNRFSRRYSSQTTGCEK